MLPEIDDQTASPIAVSVLIAAAGSGSRANLGGNKLFALVQNEPVLTLTLRALMQPDSMPDGCVLREIILAIRGEEQEQIEDCVRRAQVANAETQRGQVLADDAVHVFTVPGGQTRQSSVRAALKASSGQLIAVHDGARPFVAPELFARVLQSAREHGSAIAAMRASDTVKFAANEQAGYAAQIEQTLPRARIWLAQTPQIFRRELLEMAFDQAERRNFQGTDCASLVEALRDEDNHPIARVQLVESDARNFKITFADDISRAELMLK